MSDASVIDHLATAMISPAVGASPNLIIKAVREQTVATVADLKDPSDQDLEAALQIVPLIAVAAVRRATDIGAPFGVVESAVMKGAVEGTSEIGGDQARTAREVAKALIREAAHQGTALGLVVIGVVSGAAETRRHHTTAVTEAAAEGVMDGSAQISPEAEQAVEQVLRNTDYLPQGPITQVLDGPTKTP